jgi:ubiquinone/menaquinone biosynthesis C-methylase UbiE
MVYDRSAANRTRKRYDRMAFAYDLLEAPVERFRFAAWRRKLRDRLQGHGRILEVGVGTGKNLPYYPPGVQATAVDISRRMLKRARKRAEVLVRDTVFLEMDAQRLAFPNETFDIVFATFVFCSVPDPVAGLRELRRVCKGNGKLLLLEHMRPGNPILGFLFDRLNPLVVRVMGANINRRTISNIRAAGWQIRQEEHLSSDIVRWIEAVR